jgi:ribonuclease HI
MSWRPKSPVFTEPH